MSDLLPYLGIFSVVLPLVIMIVLGVLIPVTVYGAYRYTYKSYLQLKMINEKLDQLLASKK